MKIPVFIFSIYLIALSLVPCGDGMPQGSNPSTIVASETEQDHNHSDHQDTCSPFCTCACCGSVVTLPSAPSMEVTIVENSMEYFFHYAFDYTFNYSKGVWHPPSLS